MVWPGTTDAFLASLESLGLAGWAATGPLIELLMPALIVVTAVGSSPGPAVLSPVFVRFAGDQDLLFPCARLFCEDGSVGFGFAMTDFRNLLAFSRETASLTNTRSRERSKKRKAAFLGSDSGSTTAWIRTRPGPTRRGLNSF